MAFNSDTAVNYILTGAAKTGMFENLVAHEPGAAPSKTGLTAGCWVSTYEPATSGLNSVSMRLTMQLRIFHLLARGKAQDSVDTKVMKGVDAVLNYYIGHFQGLTGSRYVDVFGADGEMLRAALGYAEQDGTRFRIADVFIPLVINDVYSEVPNG